MTDREKEILEILKENPMISQQELADKLSITRSSTAVHITNLMKKGYIRGKGYILKKDNYITVIGGSNIDIQGVPKNPLVMFDSNPGKVDISLGGVGRNIADNIRRLGVSTKLISAVGNDLYGNQILSECKSYGIDVDDCYISNEYSTSIYVSILNNSSDMHVAISHMDILDKLDLSYIQSKHQHINDSLAIIIDTNLSEEVINFITTNYSHIPIFIDTVSTSKCMKIKNITGRFNTIKLNQYEAESLSGIKINNLEDVKLCSKYFLDTGVKNVFITLGKNGVFCANEQKSIHVKGVKIDIVSATGAGDAFTSALVYSHLNDFDLEYSAKFSMAASIIALSHKNTINPNMSVDYINKILEEKILC
ncbi:winged helix-turn-helix transcriptional regulator [Romboutsia maritimum]|uniref:Winged helix-turn-helix transcriptional regulator n=1 Tax=Romboutsia maritimum TaxID=2020948 RepID=A0A371IRA4_9FIRM|nr:PfkB family carbohydrate kinase [Romboutsia maritimum]RDY23003.1 winged helix-turn-helix transcriptional regulator [Romboutsia maritimum]